MIPLFFIPHDEGEEQRVGMPDRAGSGTITAPNSEILDPCKSPRAAQKDAPMKSARGHASS